MGACRKWLGFAQRAFAKLSFQKAITDLHTETTESVNKIDECKEEIVTFAEIDDGGDSSSQRKDLTEEDIAATRIQAIFRAHLARRAFRALRSLVKLQAVVRGVCVRRQARIALHCMHALVRLQVRVRARQLLNG